MAWARGGDRLAGHRPGRRVIAPVAPDITPVAAVVSPVIAPVIAPVAASAEKAGPLEGRLLTEVAHAGSPLPPSPAMSVTPTGRGAADDQPRERVRDLVIGLGVRPNALHDGERHVRLPDVPPEHLPVDLRVPAA